MISHIDLVLFEINGERFGADLTQVDRLQLAEVGDREAAPLGPARVGERALVIRAADGLERRLAVDALLGVERVSVSSLRKLPAMAARGPLPIGAWLDGEQMVLLVDLEQLGPVADASKGNAP